MASSLIDQMRYSLAYKDTHSGLASRWLKAPRYLFARSISVSITARLLRITASFPTESSETLITRRSLLAPGSAMILKQTPWVVNGVGILPHRPLLMPKI